MSACTSVHSKGTMFAHAGLNARNGKVRNAESRTGSALRI